MATNGEQEASMTTATEMAAWMSYPDAQRFSGLGRTKLWDQREVEKRARGD